MEKSNENLELDEYLKSIKKDDSYKDKKEINSKVNENKNQDSIINELDEYMKKISESDRFKAKKASRTRSEPSSIVYDFMKVTNHTLEDITTSLNNSINRTLEDMTYSLHNSRNPQNKKLEINISANKTQDKDTIKQDTKLNDMKTELDNAKKVDKELYRNLKTISRMTNREMDYLNNTYKEYNNLINLADECNLRIGYDQRMSGIKIYGKSKRSIEGQQRELVNILKGDTKEQQALKKSEKSINYLDSAEKRIQDLKMKNKMFDLKGNIERSQIIKEIRKEVERHKQILKDSGINSKQDFDKLKNEVLKQESYVKHIIEAESSRHKQELKEKNMEKELSKQVQLPKTENKQQENLKTKKIQLER